MKYFIIFLVLVGALAAGGYFVMNRAKAVAAANAAPPQTELVARTTLEKIVTANGKVASNRDLDVKCQASGTIMELPYSDVSAEVKPGALLLKLDPIDENRLLTTAEAVVDADNARVDEAKMNLDLAQKQLETTTSHNEAALATAQARAADAHAKADRTKSLFDSNLASKEDLETANTTAASADGDLKNAQAAMEELKQMQVQISIRGETIKEMQAALAQDQSRLDTAKTNVGYCTVTAPLADDPKDPPRWVISSLLTNIAVGGVVQSGTSGFSGGTTIMTLSDLSHIFVLASVDESDIGQISDPAQGGKTQKVHVTVDAYPHQNFEGKVVRVASKGVNTSNVVTFEVKIEVTDPKRALLRPEMTGTAKIVIDERDNVLTIPVQSFMRKPDDEQDQATVQPVAMATSTPPATAPGADSAAAASQPASRPSRGGRGRGGKGGGTMVGLPDDVPQAGTISVMVDGKPQTRDVVVGMSDGESYEVISGVQEGDEVVVNNVGAASKWRNNGPSALQMGRMAGGRR